MSNIEENIISIVEDLILEMKEYKNKRKYDNEIATFMNYLLKRNLMKSILLLTRNDIDEYFLDCKVNNKINSTSSLNTHISALKCLFDCLIKHNYYFDDKLGYVTSKGFKTKIAKHLINSKVKEIITSDDLAVILKKIDIALDLNNNNKNSKLLFVKLYLKLNFLIPLKVTEMLSIQFDKFHEEFRQVRVNDITIIIPNSLRLEIIKSLNNIYHVTGHSYDPSDSFFNYIASPIERKNVTDTGDVSRWFYSVFNAVGLVDFIKDSKKGTFAVERIKKSIIYSLITQGCNILYLSFLTGLTIDSLINEYSINDLDEISESINISLFRTNYYSYL
ncbi:hypothetical protein [Paenibacillus sp. SI8]|uniref:hypothetical protein n=1 Tax=unclassified Paenibacillus TaxID=185978 RepID=UPI003465211D